MEKYTMLKKEDEKPEEFIKFLEKKLSNIGADHKTYKHFNMKIPPIDIQIKYFNCLFSEILDKKGESLDPRRKKKKQNLDIIEDIAGLIDLGTRSARNSIFSEKMIIAPKYSVTVYFPAQFEAIRLLNNIGLDSFIDSISQNDKFENTGGKTGASFTKSHDQRFIFKEVDKREFFTLILKAQDYFNYIWETYYKSKPSLLAKIFGMYEIISDKKSTYYIAMENLFFGLNPKIKVYDLKGSELNRFVSKGIFEENKTLLDTDFKIERNGEPLPVKAEYYEFLNQGVINDTNLLCKFEVVDYSLLLIVDEHSYLIRVGIIDYLRRYDFEKQMESVGKMIIKGAKPTIIPPEDYRDRFQKAMRRYFMKINSDY